MFQQFKNTPLGAASVLFSITSVVIALLLASVLKEIKSTSQTITVTGSAEKIVVSDTAKLTVTLTRKSTLQTTSEGNKKIDEDARAAVAFLLGKGVAQKEISQLPVRTSDICGTNAQGYTDCSSIVGHDLSIDIVVESNNVEMIQDVAKTITTSLGEKNVQIRITSVEYFYNALKDIRIGLLNEATKNATERAREIARSSGSDIGKVSSASTGVFQVTQKNSVDVSDYGTYDTSTIEKKVTAVVKVSFQLK